MEARTMSLPPAVSHDDAGRCLLQSLNVKEGLRSRRVHARNKRTALGA